MQIRVPSLNQKLIVFLAPVDSAQYAKSVREDTAELASYALSDKASVQSGSPPARRSAQTQLESYFQQGADSESASNREIEGIRHHVIEEVSEPVSPEEGGPGKSPGTSVLADLLRRSPPSRSPPDNEAEGDDNGTQRDEHEVEPNQGRLIITSSGVKMDATERTPLLGKDVPFETHHPDWIRGQRDIEAQEMRRKASWPKLRNVLLWPKEKAYDIARVVANTKAWDRKAIWENAVMAPVGCIPAVVLGLLLNILDALSYGMYRPYLAWEDKR
jgi:SulP family sulfate permease